jgi:hypothetical protein
MKTLTDYKKEFEEKFGMFALLGGQRFYNGAVDNGVKIGDQWQFIEGMAKQMYEQGVMDFAHYNCNNSDGGYIQDAEDFLKGEDNGQETN